MTIIPPIRNKIVGISPNIKKVSPMPKLEIMNRKERFAPLCRIYISKTLASGHLRKLQ